MEIDWNNIQFEWRQDGEGALEEIKIDLSNNTVGNNSGSTKNVVEDNLGDDIFGINFDEIEVMELDEEMEQGIESLVREAFERPDLKVKKWLQKGGKRDFKCEICNKMLLSRSYLKKHLTTIGHRKMAAKLEKSGKNIGINNILREVSNEEKKKNEKNDKLKNLVEMIGIEADDGVTEETEEPTKESEKSNGNFKCDWCQKTFAYKCHFTQHVKSVHFEGTRNFKCEKCGKSFETDAKLKAHEAKHGGDKPFPCSKCTKSYNTKADLKRHMRNHENRMPHVCAECDRGFARNDHLQKHMLGHKIKKLKKQAKDEGKL